MHPNQSSIITTTTDATVQKTFARYWDFSVPSAEVRPTGISKVRCMYAELYTVLMAHQVNTALQLLLMGTTTISPLLPLDIGLGLQTLQCVHDFICGVPSVDILQVDRRCHNSVEWSFLFVHQRCRPHPLQTASESKSSQPATTILTPSFTLVCAPWDVRSKIRIYPVLHYNTTTYKRWFAILDGGKAETEHHTK